MSRRMKRGRHLRAVIGGLTCLVFLSFIGLNTQLSATADYDKRVDGDDDPGPIDIRSVAAGHASSRRLVHRVSTYEPWESSDLDKGAFTIEFNTDGDSRVERLLIIRYRDSEQRLVGTITKGSELEPLGYANLSRPNDTTVRAAFRRSLLRKDHLARYRWRAISEFAQSGGPCSGETGGCFDRAPDDGSVLHHLE